MSERRMWRGVERGTAGEVVRRRLVTRRQMAEGLRVLLSRVPAMTESTRARAAS